jgi:hypothetical protein
MPAMQSNAAAPSSDGLRPARARLPKTRAKPNAARVYKKALASITIYFYYR